jgi:cellulose synthase/poly-beta-1,6-N-acetylglucosamine synthase-like glycosyltransferase
MNTMRWLFWISAVGIVYVYVGYPAFAAILARLVRSRQPAFAQPSVSIVIAARNEAPRLPARVGNLLALPYPGEREIIVVSDGSTDGTAEALAPWRNRVRLIELTASGKAVALNAGVAAARHDIVVFADARQMFGPAALAKLVAPFADPKVGGVTGELMLIEDDGHGIGEGVGLYWRYEKWIRRNESAIHSTLGATGAIYALRRSLWKPLPPATLIDDVLAPMRAVLAGSRVLFEPEARAYDRVATDAATEWQRKVRTLAGNYQIVAQEPRLLVPGLNPVWWQYVSHKIGRLVVPYALVVLLVTSAALAGEGPIYAASLAGLLVVAALAVSGWLQIRARAARIAFTFVMLNSAAVAGLVALARRRRVW